jgi:hypothetical protein
MERLQQYFLANDVVSEEKKWAILLSNCGPQTYQLLKNLDHYHPKPSIIVQRFSFHTQAQKQGETIVEYVAELKRLSEGCEFTAVLNDMLRDRLVS